MCYIIYEEIMYRELLETAQKAAADYGETARLLEYPEVQADKAWYLSVLEKYNRLKALEDAASALSALISEEKELRALSSVSRGGERDAVYGEISAVLTKQSEAAKNLCLLLGVKDGSGGAYCRMLATDSASARVGEKLFALIKADLTGRGASVYGEKTKRAKGGYTGEISFTASGASALLRLAPLSGVHKAGDGLLKLAATPEKAPLPPINGDDLRVDIFRSDGAGGQNVNKVETAVRITHLPTGVSAVCRDERSRLSNERRAYETLLKRLEERQNGEELSRQSSDVARQLKIKSPLSFDPAGGRLTDGRLEYYKSYPFPMTEREFGEYIDCLIATGK